MVLKYEDDSLVSSFTLPYELKALRFDPFDCLGEFTIKKMNIEIIQK